MSVYLVACLLPDKLERADRQQAGYPIECLI